MKKHFIHITLLFCLLISGTTLSFGATEDSPCECEEDNLIEADNVALEIPVDTFPEGSDKENMPMDEDLRAFSIDSDFDDKTTTVDLLALSSFWLSPFPIEEIYTFSSFSIQYYSPPDFS